MTTPGSWLLLKRDLHHFGAAANFAQRRRTSAHGAEFCLAQYALKLPLFAAASPCVCFAVRGSLRIFCGWPLTEKNIAVCPRIARMCIFYYTVLSRGKL
ncbi:hypothetical protein GTP44_09455 [Duganella sp. FT50W]|uniref:Uncharacterized protein n=1 Tax=Duganella lactea TaxID=2692173 RepID=A0A6L8MK23_9BURK|nr:hypothetical protein [Duganella lactea]MYM82176.1 hypothetical protein [Duganella lactea]